MKTTITQAILRSILINKKKGATITSQKYDKLNIWKDEITPYLEELQNKGYISNLKNKIGINFEIRKPITLKTIQKLQTNV